MKVKLVITILSLLLFSMSILPAQNFISEVEGDMKIMGRLDISSFADSSSIYIGKNAGLFQVASLYPRNNIAVGVNAGRNNSGSSGMFFGYNSGEGNSGNENCFFGAFTGRLNEGYRNSFFGGHSGVSNTSGNVNSFFGYLSGNDNTTGSANSFFGWFSGRENETGERNTFIGPTSGGGNRSGSHNTFVGSNSGYNNWYGDGNTFIGNNAGPPYGLDSVNRSIALGNYARVLCDNCAVLGGKGSFAVNVGIGVSSPNSILHLRQRKIGPGSGIQITLDNASTWNTYVNNSKKFNFAVDSMRVGYIDNVTGDYIAVFDLRLKRDIEPISDVLSKVVKLEPTVYHYKRNLSSDPKTLGLIAQDVQALFPEIVSESEETLAISYSKLGVIAIKAIQEQQEHIKQLEQRIEQLEK